MYINLSKKWILISEYKCLSISNNETVKKFQIKLFFIHDKWLFYFILLTLWGGGYTCAILIIMKFFLKKKP